MKIVLQRVKQAAVEVNNQTVGKINKGVCLLIGVEKGDTEEEALSLIHKVTELRIFPDKEGKMNLSLLDIQGEVLAVSQFTLAASLKKGRRPGFDNAEDPERAENLFRFFVDMIKEKGIKVETGIFGALMDVHLVNEGPVTFILEKKHY